MRGGDGDQRRNSQGSARRASGSGASGENNEEEEDEQKNESNVEEDQGYESKDAIVLDASYNPQEDDFPGEDEEEEDEEEEEEEEEEDDALEVVIETLLGDTFRVRVSQWDTAAGLKNLLFRTQGIPMSHQHLLLGQTELLDDVCLINQNVVDGSTLRLVLHMKGGPINARRLPTHHDIMRDITEYVDSELEGEKLEENGGRTVTLLVLRDGDNINVYRVVENNDGSFTPLNESFSSVKSMDQLEKDTLQAAEDGAKTRARMKELQARMDAAKNKKKAKKEKGKLLPSQRSMSRASRGSLDRHEEKSTVQGDVSESPGKAGEPGSRPLSTSNRRIPNSANGRRTSLISHRAGRNSRPTTQERRNSLSKTSTILKGIPMAFPPVPVDFSGRKPLDSIPSRIERNRLSAVDEEFQKRRNTSQPPDSLSRSMNNAKNYESYRKSLIRHGLTDRGAINGSKDSREAWPRREASMPLYMPSVGSVPKRYDGMRLNRSHNQDYLRVARVSTSIRPKTSPEILEHRPSTSSKPGNISERLQLRAPDEQLHEICTILSNSRGNSRQSMRSNESPPPTARPPSHSTSFSGSTGLQRPLKNNSVSVSLSSLRGHGGTPPSPAHGALVASGSKEQREILREIMKNQTSSSRRTTPESHRSQVKRPVSSRLHATPPYLPPVTPPRRGRKQKPKCAYCSKRIKLVTTHVCRCDRIFCTQHRLPETHECTYDFKTEGRKLIEMANPLVASHRLPKI
ncbi:AN1-type zinc finger protein 4-like [Palaemon carinicauda]|uniref:AN1-type zinc finger protein 4-like n=1 Tax=Palaemon carinicauda TaxID=392227 RepID=UPI0035B5CA20